MSSSTGVPTTNQHTLHTLRCLRTLVGLRRILATVSLALLVGLGMCPAIVHAATSTPATATIQTTPASPVTTVQDQPQLVFTMGTVARVGHDAVTLRFEDGQTETYNVGAATTFQTQDGDAATLQDLDVGDMAMIITSEGSSTASVIVDGGNTGFNAGGPYDIGEHEGS